MALALFSLAGKTALVTGGNGGLGLTFARALQAAGAAVAVTGRDAAKNAAAAAALGPDALVLPLDVRDEPAVERAVAAVVERFGGLDVLVANAGNFKGAATTELARDAWDDVVSTHLTGAMLSAKHAARAMIARGRGGKIVTIGSMYSVFGSPRSAPYTAAKHGVIGLTKSLAVELAPHGIQVNAILPGWFETDLSRGLPATPRGENIRRKTPAGRWGDLDALAGTIIYLASAASDFVTGASIPVDGGYLVSDRFSDA